MTPDDIRAGRKRVDELLDLAERYFIEGDAVNLDFAALAPVERDIYLHLKDHIFTAASAIHATETPESPRIIEEWEGEEVPSPPRARIREEWEEWED